MDTEGLESLLSAHMLPVFGKPQLWLAKGAGMQVWDVNGKEYLD